MDSANHFEVVATKDGWIKYRAGTVTHVIRPEHAVNLAVWLVEMAKTIDPKAGAAFREMSAEVQK